MLYRGGYNKSELDRIKEKGKHISLSSHQTDIIQQVVDWYRTSNSPMFTLGGTAGVGKSYILPAVIERLKVKSPVIATYTAKAALVLHKKGIPIAQTIHSLIYVPKIYINKKGIKVTTFVKRDKLQSDIIIIDEASMVSVEIHKDLLSFKIPILYVGDYFQLPPINDNFNLMEEDNLNSKLIEIHRQAQDNPIIKMATDVRLGKSIEFHNNGITSKISMDKLSDETLLNASQIITGKNITRNNLNTQIRKFRGFKTPKPQKDEKLIFLKNDYKLGVFNGQQIIVMEDPTKQSKNVISINYLDHCTNISELLEAKPSNVRLWLKGFNKTVTYEDYDKLPKDTSIADFGYVISVYKAQGSEWDNVIFYDDLFGTWDSELRQKYVYTAITRASSKLIWAV